ncbi:MAG: hypothetical protein M1834_000991 [Cirrosporium novae-zelandiae]|nr:MAG: hypothetical protein M1834_000991 [Cirrosporium novae-zelandiae]
MSESYLRVGRGGAGNFYPQDDADNASIQARRLATAVRVHTLMIGVPSANGALAQDLESQRSTSSSTLSSPKEQPAEYGHYGRGGAGNYFSSRELESHGTITTETITHVRGRSFYQGRGGAGNYNMSMEDIKSREEAERVDEERVRQRIQYDVEACLGRPPKAYLRA